MTSYHRFAILIGLAFALIVSLVPTVAVLRADDTHRPMQAHDFTDVPVAGKEFMEPFINAFYHQGITTGCNPSPLQYCPEQNVTRGEMAVFVGRALGYVEAANIALNTRAYFKNNGSGYGMVAASVNGFGMRASGVYGVEAYGTFGSGVHANSTDY